MNVSEHTHTTETYPSAGGHMVDIYSSTVSVIVKLTLATVGDDGSAHRYLQACGAEIGISIQPLHPSTSDPELASYYIARVDPSALDGVIQHLFACKGVEGAYAKPQGEEPKGE
jgi:hypothetical protein